MVLQLTDSQVSRRMGVQTKSELVASTVTTLREAFEAYKRVFLGAGKLAPKTCTEYSHDVDDLISFLQRRCLVLSPNQVEPRQIERYLSQLASAGATVGTRRRRLAATRSFFGFLASMVAIKSSPASQVRPPEREEFPPRVLSLKEAHDLQQVCAPHTRDSAIVALLLGTGIRLSELSRLTLIDIVFEEHVPTDPKQAGNVHIRGGRHRPDRIIYFGKEVGGPIARYLATRPVASLPQVFLSRFATALKPRAVEYVITKRLCAANIKAASVHSLRHTFAVRLLRSGASTEIACEVLGHQDPRTLERYRLA